MMHLGLESIVSGSVALAALSYVKNIFHFDFVSSFVHSRTVCTMHITSNEKTYNALDHWCSNQVRPNRKRLVEVFHASGKRYRSQVMENVTEMLDYQLVLGKGVFYGRWNGVRLIITKNWTDQLKDERLFELTITAWSQNPGILEEMVREAIYQYPLAERMFKLYLYKSSYEEWVEIKNPSVRKLNTLVYNHGVLEDVVADFEQFENRKNWYQERGIPYHRGYLLYGTHGTGKTSLAKALAYHFKRKLYTIDASAIRSSDELINQLRLASSYAIIVFEDFDAIQKSREDPSEDNSSEERLSMSGLLNALDGVATPDGQIYIMTTNYIDRIDPALLRPGRIDRKIELKALEAEAQRRMGLMFYPDHSFVPFDTPISPADLQEAFTIHPEDAIAARQYLELKFKDQNSCAPPPAS